MPNNLKKKVTLIGSTGLIGTHFLEEISPDDFQYVKAISRRKIPNLDKKHFIKQSVHNFSELEIMRQDLKTDILVTALGTTIKKVGSKDKFIKIDHDLPLKISRIANEEGCRSMILISAIGANEKSNIFYNHVKGLLEIALDEIGFEELHILRPSLLLGKRIDPRPAEYIAKLLMEQLSPLIPWKYKPIHASIIAKKIKCICLEEKPGKHIWEGRKLFNI